MENKLDKELLIFKGECFIVTFVVAMIGGLLPLYSKKHANSKLRAMGACFSGGVFLSAALSHMLSEAIEGFASMGEQYKLSPFIYCIVGILLPFFVEKVLMSNGGHDVGKLLGSAEKSNSTTTSMLLLMLMLSIHSLVEGLALGVQDDMANTTTVLWAVISHKFFDAFAVGMSIVKADITVNTLQLISFFSLTTPCGIVIGLLLSTLSTSVDGYVSESIKAVAAGTFLYISLIEVIMEEFGNHHHHGKSEDHGEDEKKNSDVWKKFLMIIVGVVVMTYITTLTQHSHSSPHSHPINEGHSHSHSHSHE